MSTEILVVDDDCHTMFLPGDQLDVNLPTCSNVSHVTESTNTSPICCNTFERNDLNDEKYMCGACKLYFRSVCQLHSHLNSKHSTERYIFDFSIITAFPEMDKVCRQTQTDLKDLIELDKEQNVVETDCFDDNIKVECNYNAVDSDILNAGYSTENIKLEGNFGAIESTCSADSDTLNPGYSDVSYVATTDPTNFTTNSQNKRSKDRSKLDQMKRKRARINCTSPQNNSEEQIKETGNDRVIDANDILDNDEDENIESSNHQASKALKLYSGAPNEHELPLDKLTIPDDKVDQNVDKVDPNVDKCLRATKRKKLKSKKNSLSSVKTNQQGTVTGTSADDKESSYVYQCQQCDTKCPSMSSLQYHFVITHSTISDNTLRNCRWCKKTLQGVRSYLAHTSQCVRNENLICFICDQSFPAMTDVLNHLVSHKNSLDNKCKFCQKSFTNEFSLHHHLSRHYKEKSILCENCGKAFYSQHDLSSHLRYDTCNKDLQIKCDQCDMTFKTDMALKNHQILHSDDTPYVCHVCGYTAKRVAYLTRHLRTHTSERPYSCSHCGVKFASQTDLIRHEKIHTNDKPFACTYCEKSFITNWNLKTHLRQHTGDTPYKCELCGKAFKQNVLLKLHRKSHHTLIE